MQVQQSTNIREEIQKMKGLLPLPVIAQQLLDVINDEDASIDDISEIIKRAPALMSRLLEDCTKLDHAERIVYYPKRKIPC